MTPWINQYSFCINSKLPVPPFTIRPATRQADGDCKESVSPDIVALFKKCIVVSKLIFWRGELLVSNPILLKALYDPS